MIHIPIKQTDPVQLALDALSDEHLQAVADSGKNALLTVANGDTLWITPEVAQDQLDERQRDQE